MTTTTIREIYERAGLKELSVIDILDLDGEKYYTFELGMEDGTHEIFNLSERDGNNLVTLWRTGMDSVPGWER